jgi:macrolide-specific efflux system membrane fusion protein
MKKIGIISISLIVCAVIGFIWWKNVYKSDFYYEEARVEREDISATILSTGTVQPENRLEIKPPVNGRAEKVMVQEGDKVKKGQILVWMSSSERATLIDAARTVSKKELKRWEDLYPPTAVVAPIDGMIILRNLESGQSFTSTDPVLVMSDRLTVKAQVDETDIATIKLKEKAEIILDAYPDVTIKASVDQIAYDAKTINNVTTYLVDVLPIKTPEFMRSGMTANVTFMLQTKKNVLCLPTDFIKQDGDYALVLTRGANGEVKEQSIQVGINDGKKTEILEGLAENDIVLLQRKIRPKGPTSSPFSTMRKKSN